MEFEPIKIVGVEASGPISKAEEDFFAPFVAVRLETESGELVHLTKPPRGQEAALPAALRWNDRVFQATFLRHREAHVFAEVIGKNRVATEAACVLFDVE